MRLPEHVEANTLVEFATACKAAKQLPERVFVVVHLFSGAARPQDFEWHLRDKMRAAGLKVLCI